MHIYMDHPKIIIASGVTTVNYNSHYQAVDMTFGCVEGSGDGMEYVYLIHFESHPVYPRNLIMIRTSSFSTLSEWQQTYRTIHGLLDCSRSKSDWTPFANSAFA